MRVLLYIVHAYVLRACVANLWRRVCLQKYPGWTMRVYTDNTSIPYTWACPLACQYPHLDFCDVADLPGSLYKAYYIQLSLSGKQSQSRSALLGRTSCV